MNVLQGKTTEILHNVVVGLAVSIVMINLGAALGILSGRGAFAGMLSAGIIAFVTSAFGGTRIQGSGTTAPMSTVTAVIVAYALESLPQEVAGMRVDHFVNIVLGLTAVCLAVFGVLRLGRLISYVPNLVISGFMCGIAVIIWLLQVESLFGLGGKEAIGGSVFTNVAIVAATLCISFLTPVVLRKYSQRLSSFVPGTLVALLVVSIVAVLFNVPVETLHIESSVNSLSSFVAFVADQVPTSVSMDVVWLALPFALQLAGLCYIDTLLTSLIVDKMTDTKTQQSKELMAQGAATGIVALIGGVPGAQSTVPSVLMIKEGATMRLAGIFAGLFVLLHMALFSSWMNYIPQAVFAGILIKVGYDVFDFKAMGAYARTLKRQWNKQRTRVVGHKEMMVIAGTTLVTAFIDLIVAVGAFTVGFHLFNKSPFFKKHLRDYVPG